jgi:acetolactate synthase-1/2/3 large subunit
MLGESRRPIVWAGGGAIDAGAPILALLDAGRAGLVTSNSGRGVVPEDHPRCIGNFATSPATRALLHDADLLISVGTHFRSNETAQYTLELPQRHVQIDVDPAALGRAYPVDVGLVGDAAAVLERLAPSVVPTGVDPKWVARVEQVRSEVRTALRSEIGYHATICDSVRRTFPNAAPFVRDVTIATSSWGNRLFELFDPRTNIFARGGGIGQGLGMALGAATARPDLPVVAVVGDGGLAVHMGDLLTIAQERPWITILVFNDRGYGVLRNLEDAAFGRRSGVDLHTADLRVLAEATGLSYSRVTDAAMTDHVLVEALHRRGPTLVEFDVDALGPMPRPYMPPVARPVESSPQKRW